MAERTAAKPVAGAAKDVLSVSAELFKLLVDTVADYAIFVIDIKGNIITWNRGARRMNGYSAEEVIGSHISRFYTADDIIRNHPEHEMLEAQLHGRYEEEGWRVRKGGARFWANVVLTKLVDEQGAHVGFANITRDLTERKEADERLRKSEERLRLMIAGVKDYAIYMLDPKGFVTSWNEGAERFSGYKAHEIIGQHFSRFYPQEDIDRRKPEYELEGAAATGRFEDEGWRKRKDGSLYWSNVIITAVRDSNGTLIGFSKVTRDLSERKRTEEALEHKVVERTAELSKAVRARDEFMSVASHELKTPLTSLMLQAQIRKRNLAKSGHAFFTEDKLRAMLDNDERQIRRLTRLVDDMLDISRISLGKFMLDFAEHDLSELVRDVVSRFKPQFDEQGVAVNVSTPGQVIGSFDHFRIEQVIANLLTNALKYGACKPVDVTVSSDGKTARIDVRDHGIGISKIDQQRIFRQFERAVSANEVSGLGLGLYITRQIVEAHGGTIDLSSSPGVGSTFTVELPLRR